MLEVAPNLGIAVGTDGVGSKLILAEQTGRYDTVGIDCVAMNVNDVVCVGAEPIALLDYLAVEQADPDVMEQIGIGLKRGAELAGVEIPGGEVAILPELIRGHPSPNGFDLTATCFGTVALDADGHRRDDRPRRRADRPARAAACTRTRTRSPAARSRTCRSTARSSGGTLADALLEPTVIYVRAALDLLRSDVPVHGLAHITGGGLLNLLRLNERVGFAIEDPLPVPPIIALVQRARRRRRGRGVGGLQHGLRLRRGRARGDRPTRRPTLLAAHHPGTRRIGTVTARPGASTRRRRALLVRPGLARRSRPEAARRRSSSRWPRAGARSRARARRARSRRPPCLPVLARVGDLLAELLGPLLASHRPRARGGRPAPGARSSRTRLPVFLLRARALGELLAQVRVLVRAPLVRALLGRQLGCRSACSRSARSRWTSSSCSSSVFGSAIP